MVVYRNHLLLSFVLRRGVISELQPTLAVKILGSDYSVDYSSAQRRV